MSKQTVTIKQGPLEGFTVTAVSTEEIDHRSKRVTYEAPDNGPRVKVLHRQQLGEYTEAGVSEDVRNAYSHLIPNGIVWSKGEGYKREQDGTPLRWDNERARFVLAPATSDQRGTAGAQQQKKSSSVAKPRGTGKTAPSEEQ